LYRRNKDFGKLSLLMEIRIGSKHYLHVYIWETHEAMYINCGAEKGDGGYYLGLPYKYDTENDVPLPKPKFGEIHLVLDYFGAGTFAHELQHFILDWIDTWDLVDNDETICWTVGKMTTEFWNKFYDNYGVIQNEHAE